MTSSATSEAGSVEAGAAEAGAAEEFGRELITSEPEADGAAVFELHAVKRERPITAIRISTSIFDVFFIR
jgi:hypothetical protein